LNETKRAGATRALAVTAKCRSTSARTASAYSISASDGSFGMTILTDGLTFLVGHVKLNLTGGRVVLVLLPDE
jgi:hypothetical protein